jgi:hypothetical protein
MNKLTKAVLLGATVALAGQGAYAQTGDLILGFTGNSATTDTTFDLGSLSTTAITTGTLDAGGLSGFTFSGVMGNFGNSGTQGSGIDLSVARTGSTSIGLQGSESAPVAPVASSLPAAINDAGSIIRGSGVPSFTLNSYSANTTIVVPGTDTSTFYASDGNYSTLVGNGTAMDIFSETQGAAAGRGGVTPVTVTYVGQLDLTLGASGDSYEFIPANISAVPEPAAYGLMAGAGLLALALRRRFNAKNA